MSRPSRPFVAFGFASVHDALDAETTLRAHSIEVLAVPSPRELGDLCGIALRVEPDAASRAERVLRDAGKAPIAKADFTDR